MQARSAALAAAAIALLVFATSGCAGEPELVFADWIIDVPDGTPVLEYAPVPVEGRDPAVVRLVEDLVIGGDLGNSEAVLFEPGPIVATDDGNVFVGDRGANDVKMYGPDGAYIKTLGQEGQGPGEFARIGEMAAAGGFLVIRDTRNLRLSVWTLDGEHVADHGQRETLNSTSLFGLADGTLTGLSFSLDGQGQSEQLVVGHWTAEGEEISQLFSAGFSTQGVRLDLEDPLGFTQQVLDTLDEPRLVVDVSLGETLVITPVTEYQLLALTPDGDARWALRVAWRKTPWPETQRQPFIDALLTDLPFETPPDPGDLTWPEQSPPMFALDTDGAGRIYVFLTPRYIRYPGPDDEYPVDVYSPEGEFVAAGVIHQRWSYAAGEHVYGLRPDPFDEIEVVRYRIEVNQ